MALCNLKVIELAGLAPVPFAGMVLGDFGADVIRVDRSDSSFTTDVLSRGKRSMQVNLKHQEGIQVLKHILKSSDVLLDPFRPGVLERLGLSPSELLKSNPRLIVARLTGFGQTGPLSRMAGHDINYIAVSGILSMLGRKGDKPVFPANLLGDFAGGSLMCVIGILIALIERTKSGKGQIVDAAMVDGVSYLSSMVFKMREKGLWNSSRGENVLDSGAPFYDVYKTKDELYMAVGAIEPHFYKQLLDKLGISETNTKLQAQMDPDSWDELRSIISRRFLTRTQKEWTQVFTGSDACVTPVVGIDDAHNFEHNAFRHVYVTRDGESFEPAAAPRLSLTPARNTDKLDDVQPGLGEHTYAVLAEFGYSKEDIQRLAESGIVRQLKNKSKL